MKGLSPRLRGNLQLLPDGLVGVRSIPAPAGEPAFLGHFCGPLTVYPRACGGTPFRSEISTGWLGLSPRLRGNRHGGKAGRRSRRSIPAPAGEPGRSFPAGPGRRVYPRACGGTDHDLLPFKVGSGLSPRLRGNRALLLAGCLGHRSIPAPAGEPLRCVSPQTAKSVYPRACGGTTGRAIPARYRCGLSPRLRGNLPWKAGVAPDHRSIPAPAGEPYNRREPRTRNPVYPRACGGTAATLCKTVPLTGLSPRLRGNLVAGARPCRTRRSIPAPAGEPAAGRPPQGRPRVYPRACGGTSIGRTWKPNPMGLSPRLRGNRHPAGREQHHLRSIPAPAGEPGIAMR